MAESKKRKRKSRGAASDAGGRQQSLPLTWDEPVATEETAAGEINPVVDLKTSEDVKASEDDAPPWEAEAAPPRCGGVVDPDVAEVLDAEGTEEETVASDPEAEALEWDVEPGPDDEDREDGEGTDLPVRPENEPFDAQAVTVVADDAPHSEAVSGVGGDTGFDNEVTVEPEPPDDLEADAAAEDQAEVFDLEQDLPMSEPERSAPDVLPTADDPAEEPRIVQLGETVMSLGQTLAEARGAQNMTLAQVAQKTRIPKDMIEHLETDQFELLPPPIYMRSHISHLCDEYEIDSKEILREYEQLVALDTDVDENGGMVVTSEPAESGSKVQYRIAGGATLPNSKGSGRVTRLLVGATIALLIVLVVTAFGVQQWRNHQRQSVGPEGVPGAENTAPLIDLEQFVIPQQLQLKELPVPEE